MAEPIGQKIRASASSTAGTILTVPLFISEDGMFSCTYVCFDQGRFAWNAVQVLLHMTKCMEEMQVDMIIISDISSCCLMYNNNHMEEIQIVKLLEYQMVDMLLHWCFGL